MKKHILASVFFGLLAVTVSAQDFHYSLFHMAPLTVNPALTGNFTGDLRVINNYRTQWSAVSKPFVTYSLGADMPFQNRNKRKQTRDFFALGLNVNVDKAGSSMLRNNSYNVSGSYNKSLDGGSKTFFSFGVQAGLNQRSIDLSQSTWGRQFNGLTYDAALPNGEASAFADAYFFIDMAAGAAITTNVNDRFKMNVGLGAHHLARPRISFLGSNDQLYRKLMAHWSAQIRLSEGGGTYLLPRVLFARQGPSQLINLGLGMKFKLSERSRYTNYQEEKSFSFGGMYRTGDALSAWVRIDYGPVGAALNYDFNVSRLTPASQGRGAVEAMVIYTGIFHNQNTRLASPSFF
ncbi:MAG: PorP/SprF family type IX secretion system membrane protein [Bacteroidetes bacterium]|nr:PorP/SprF family type IX secretion system membrane protein [Bacteroidota bacterium]